MAPPVRSTASRMGTYPNTVTRWRERFLSDGVEGIGVIRDGRGRKPGISAATIEAIVHDTLHTVPENGSVCWSTRSMAARYGIGKDTVARVWKARHLAAVAGGHVQVVDRLRTSRPSWSMSSGCLWIL